MRWKKNCFGPSTRSRTLDEREQSHGPHRAQPCDPELETGRMPGRKRNVVGARPGCKAAVVVLPADGHVHSEWSWDAPHGSMERTCARAVDLGLPAVAFTEHADYTTWIVLASDLDEHQHLTAFTTPDGSLTPPKLDLDGYLECVQRCRDTFPDLRIITGVELGEPHWHGSVATRLLEAGHFDRVLGSLHCLPLGQRFSEMPNLCRQRPAAEVVREYLTELPPLIGGWAGFAVLTHIDYAIRYWPTEAGPFDPYAFEDEFRHALGVLADSGRALEINTSGAPESLGRYRQIVDWWRDEGGKVVTFGSDAHDPTAIGRGFAEAAAMVEAYGFRPGRHPYDIWTRSG
jgi:histidinol-phosphatase (PHP family)